MTELIFLLAITLASWAAVLPVLIDSGRATDRVVAPVAVATVPDIQPYDFGGLV